MTSIKPVVIHCTVGKLILNSCINVVSATLSNVSFKMAKKAPINKDNIIGTTLTLGSSIKNSNFSLSLDIKISLFQISIFLRKLIYLKSIGFPFGSMGSYLIALQNTLMPLTHL